MALDTIWMAIASVLSVYNISKAVDSHGNVITPEVKMNRGVVRQVPQIVSIERFSLLVSHPAPFNCQIEPRSRAALALIQHAGLGAK